VHSWLDEFWRRRYLGRRDRIALNANYFFLFSAGDPDQMRRAAGLLAAAVDYKQRVDTGKVPPEAPRGQPQSMQQLRYLFGTTRVPGEEIDDVRTPYSRAHPGPATARHIVVFARGHMFRLDVLDREGRAYAAGELANGLRAVLAAAPTRAEPGTSVGALTTEARAEWAADRAALLALEPGDAEGLEAVETALLCLCLDDTAPASPLAAADRLLAGEAANRWFDKAVSLIVFADGAAGLNGEHCTLDGTTMISFLEAIMDAQPWPEGSRRRTPDLAPLDFLLDEALRGKIQAAGEAFAAYAAEAASTTVAIDGFGSERAKTLGISPDAFAQLAFQLAHHRAKGHLGATYESIATRGFHHGRTEAMRVITPEMVDFVATLANPGTDDDTRATAARTAAEAHVARATACRAGQAPEQHLWELELIQQRRGADGSLRHARLAEVAAARSEPTGGTPAGW
jgi:carnitine O-acetyltransferase